MLVDPVTTTFVLPRYFGSRRWSVPTREIGVIDLAAPWPQSGEAPVVFDPDLRVEQLWSGARDQNPTTTLCFEQPVRIPPIRLVARDRNGIRWREARSAEGVHLDGVRLTFTDPTAAHRTLTANGAEAAGDSGAWWRRHGRPFRPFDELEHEELGVAVRAFRRDNFVAMGVLLVAAALVSLARWYGSLWPAIPAAVLVVAGRVLIAVARRRLVRRKDEGAAAARRRLGVPDP